MRLLVLGATGRTGSEILELTQERNHTVRALVRDPARLGPAASGLECVAGGVTDPSALSSALAGVDAAAVVLGADKSAPDLASQAARSLVPALESQGVKRVVILSSFGVGATLHMASPMQRLAYRTVLRRLFADKAVADATWMASALDWTLVYAVRLTNGAGTDEYAAVGNCRAKGFPAISRLDVARFMLDEVEEGAWLRRVAVLGPNRSLVPAV